MSDNQLETLNEKLIDKMFNNPYIELSYFNDWHTNEEIDYVHKVDVLESELKLTVNREIKRLSLLDIIEIK